MNTQLQVSNDNSLSANSFIRHRWYEVIVDSAFGLVNYHHIDISSLQGNRLVMIGTYYESANLNGEAIVDYSTLMPPARVLS